MGFPEGSPIAVFQVKTPVVPLVLEVTSMSKVFKCEVSDDLLRRINMVKSWTSLTSEQFLEGMVSECLVENEDGTFHLRMHLPLAGVSGG